MSKKLVHVMDTSFRDGFQSVFGARVFTKDFLPALESAKDAGIRHFEAGGGARFQALYFYCKEDAFNMMDVFRRTVGPDIDLQTLARGINVVGLESQSRDIIKLHAKLFKKHGITVIRNFDALNDVNNLIYSGQCIAEAGLKHEVVITMMELPPGATGAHTPEFYMQKLREILDADIPYHSVCFKDASGTAAPQKVYETIKQAKQMLPEGTHISFHTHETAGTSILTYKAALDAGCEGISLAMAPVSGGTSQPDIITMWHALRGTEYELEGVDIDKIRETEQIFKECMKDYFIPPEATAVEPIIPFCPMPGGALTANTQMLRDNNIMDKYSDIITAMAETVEKGGYGTSVTPVSQFYFQQAFNNVIFGPWEKIAEGYGKMVLGYFGKTPVPPDPEVVKIASEQLELEPTTRNPLEINDEDPKKGIDAAKKLLAAENLSMTEENIFIAATCKDKGIAFLKGQGQIGVRKVSKKQEKTTSVPDGYTVTVNNKKYSVVMEGNKAIVNGKTYNVGVKEGLDEPKVSPTDKSRAATSDAVEVKAPLPGNILKITCNVADSVKEGQTIMILEAMKMETKIKAPKSGTVSSLSVSAGDQVNTGQTLAWIG